MGPAERLPEFSRASEVRAWLNGKAELPFSHILSEEKIWEAVKAVNLRFRKRVFSPVVLIWTFLSQVLSEDQSCQAAVIRLIAFLASRGEKLPSKNTAAYCQARLREPEELFTYLARATGEEADSKGSENWLWRGRKIKLVDGTTLSAADTPENQNAYPQPKSQKPGVGFPLLRLVAVISYSTGAFLNMAMGRGIGAGEAGLLRKLMSSFEKGDVVLADRYYASYWFLAEWISSGVDFVLPQHGARHFDFRSGTKLGPHDHVTMLKKPKDKPKWMSVETYRSYPNEIAVRETKIERKRKGYRTQNRVFVTSFLRSREVSKGEMTELYSWRWFIELDLRAIKTLMKMDVLHGKTPQMVRKEIWAHVLAYNLIRKIMVEAAVKSGKTLRQLSFKTALQLIESFRLLHLAYEATREELDLLLKLLATSSVGNRPGRQEPRAVKRRPKRGARLLKPRSEYKKGAA